jgi:hypothetical protein
LPWKPLNLINRISHRPHDIIKYPIVRHPPNCPGQSKPDNWVTFSNLLIMNWLVL